MRSSLYALGLIAALGCGRQDSLDGVYDPLRPVIDSPAVVDVPVDTIRYHEFSTRLSRPVVLLCTVDLRKNKGELRALGEFTRCVDMDSLYTGYGSEQIFYDTNEDGKIDAEYNADFLDDIVQGSCTILDEEEQQDISTLISFMQDEYARKRLDQ